MPASRSWPERLACHDLKSWRPCPRLPDRDLLPRSFPKCTNIARPNRKAAGPARARLNTLSGTVAFGAVAKLCPTTWETSLRLRAPECSGVAEPLEREVAVAYFCPSTPSALANTLGERIRGEQTVDAESTQ